ncbi:MAG: thioredoxin family protein [Thermoanaerobaculia bacterium]
MKRFPLLAVLALIVVPQLQAGPWIKSVATAQKKAKAGDKLIFVDLFADWCGWCHKMEQEVFPSEVFQKATDDMVLLRLDTEDGGEGTELAQRFSVRTLPTFLVLTPDMSVAGVIRGYAPASDFVESLKNVEKQHQAFEKRVKNEASIATDYQKRLDLAREFTQRFALSDSEVRLKKLVNDKGAPVNIRDAAWYELTVSQVLQKKYAEALKTIAAFGKVQTKGESYERARLLAGQIYMEQGNILGAANEFRNFKATFPNSPLIRNVDMVLPDLERRLARR